MSPNNNNNTKCNMKNEHRKCKEHNNVTDLWRTYTKIINQHTKIFVCTLLCNINLIGKQRILKLLFITVNNFNILKMNSL